VGAGGRPVVGSRVGVVGGALGGWARIDHLHHWWRGGIAGLGLGWIGSGGGDGDGDGDGDGRESTLGGGRGRLGGGHVDLAGSVAS